MSSAALKLEAFLTDLNCVVTYLYAANVHLYMPLYDKRDDFNFNITNFFFSSIYMRRRFTIYSAFLDIKNSISWYQEIHFLISRNAFFDIKNSISWYQEIIHIFWYQEIEFLISRNDFLISRNWFLDIKMCILRRRFTIYLKVFLDINNLISWYQEFISWFKHILFQFFHEKGLGISFNNSICALSLI